MDRIEVKGFISCHLMGGLGNQMFQISKALAEGEKHHRKVIFFLPKNKILEYLHPFSKYQTIFKSLNFSFQTKEFDKILEKSFTYQPLNPGNRNTQFWGYFQSSKHFYGLESTIASYFAIPKLIKTYLSLRYPGILEEHSLAIHIRRGDYLLYPERHSVLDLSYYYHSLQKIPMARKLYVFSDDLAWVKQHFKVDNAIFVDEKLDFMALWMMSMCHHRIISNSTFSWWADFLCQRENKITIAPSEWFGPQGENSQDIYEGHWTITKVIFTNGALVCNE